MIIFFLGITATVLAIAGRRIFGSWFNHLSMYSVIWGGSLILFELRFIDYYRLEPETWIYIGLGWVSFTAGSLLLPAAGYAPGGAVTDDPPSRSGVDRYDQKRLRNAILVLSGIALAAVVQHWMILLEKFGSIFNVIVLGNIVYSLRLSEGMPVGVPYFDSFGLAGSFFAGLYISSRKRFSLLGLLPFLVVIAEAVGLMGRVKVLIAVILFLSGYFLHSRMAAVPGAAAPRSFVRKFATVGIAILLFAVAGEIVRSNRGIPESIPGSNQALRTLSRSSFITPSVYLYLTVDHGVFNQYLRKDEERALWGSNTFAPVYRFLSTFGFETDVGQYQRFYSTPANANTGSYLREVHSDFGMAGILVVPFVIGCLCSVFWLKSVRGGRIVPMVVLAHLLVIVDLSFITMSTRLGYWLVSLLAGLAAAWYVDRGRDWSGA